MNAPSPQAKLLVKQLFPTFRKANLTDNKEHFTDVVHCFFELLHLPIEVEDLAGLRSSIEGVLDQSFTGNETDRQKAFGILVIKVEPWLKKLLWFLNQTLYEVYTSQKRGAAAYYQYFELIPPQGKPFTGLQRQMKETYDKRNKTAHAATDSTINELHTQIINVWIAYLFPIIKNLDTLRKITAMHQLPDLRPYLKEMHQDFKEWKKRFVAIKGYELQYMRGKAIERLTDPLIEREDLPKKDIEEWRDEMVQLRKRKSTKQKQMMIWGAAGTGKSTTLMVLSFEDAKKKEAHYEDFDYPIPVFLALNRLVKQVDLIGNIADKLKLDVPKTKALLEKGDLRLYLDGFNEITAVVQGKRKNEIEAIFKTYPKTFVLLTTRPEDKSLFEYRGFRIFDLLSMDRAQIRLFLTKNTIEKSTRQIISQAIRLEEGNRAKKAGHVDTGFARARQLFRLLQTPLFLFYLIQIVDETKKIPGSESKIVTQFIDQLLNRERKDKAQTKMKTSHIRLLLEMLGFYSLEKYKTNDAMSTLLVESWVQKLIEKYRIDFSVDDFLQLVTGLNILRLDHEQYTFSHQIFQNSFHSKGSRRYDREMEAADEL